MFQNKASDHAYTIMLISYNCIGFSRYHKVGLVNNAFMDIAKIPTNKLASQLELIQLIYTPWIAMHLAKVH